MKKKQKKKITQLQTTDSNSRRHLIAIALLVISIVFAYLNSLNGTWAMDDVVANKTVGINDIHDLVGFRKVAYITFLLNQFIAPFNPASFRVFNILIHILNAVLVYVLAYRTMKKIPPPTPLLIKGGWGGFLDEKKSFYVALLSSVIFALHPININAVAYIVQRMASLATLFVLLSLLCYISATQSSKNFKAVLLYILTGICVVAGIFSKENAVMAIPLIILYDYFFLSRFNSRMFLKRMFVITGIGVLSIGLASYFLRFHAVAIDLMRLFLNLNQPFTRQGWMAVDVYWTPLQHILTEFRVLSRYIFLLFLPLPRFLVFDWWGFPISSGITDPITTLLSIILLLSLFIFSIWKMKQFPLLCFGILWYLIAISLESFFALGSDLYFEHRNYLPLSGLIIGSVGQVVMSFKGKIKERAVWASVIILCMTLGSLTVSRNFVWKDSLTLWGDTLKKNPSNIRAQMAMGNAYLKLSDIDSAKSYYKEVVKISSKDKRLYFFNDSVYSLGMLYLFKGELKQAKELIVRFDYSIESYRPRILKGYYKALSNDIDGALRDYKEVIKETEGIDSVVVFTLMGDAYREKGLFDNAIEQYNKAISLDPGFSAAYYGIGASYLSKREIERADYYFNKTLSIDPNNVLALSDMADLILIRGANPGDALTYAQRAISKSPPFSQPYLTMGNVLVFLGRNEEAEDFYKKAMEHGLSEYMVPFSKARTYYMKGEVEKAQYYLSELQRYKNLPDKVKNIIKQKK